MDLIFALQETNHTKEGFDWLELVNFPKLSWWKYLVFGGICSGLTLGLLSIDKMSLSILLEAGTDREKKYARRLSPIISRHHLLLVTLLLWNALAMETLPLFLDRMLPEFIAIVLSVTFVLLFGEIIPQSIISRFGLAIGGNLFWFVWILIGVAFPIAWPISKLLDCLLGHNHSTLYKKAELKELVDLHGVDEGGHLTTDEITVLRGALDLRDKRADNIMTPLSRVFMIDIETKLNEETIDLILQHGHSRVPVYEGSKQNIVGLLLVKSLIKLSPADATPLRQVELRDTLTVYSDIHAYDLLNMFQHNKAHMAIVKSKPLDEHHEASKVIGIVTLEDIFEELIQEEIVDETDVFVDVDRQIRVADMFRRLSQQITRSVATNSPQTRQLEQQRLIV